MLTIDATDPKSGTAEFKAAAIRIEKLAGRWTCAFSQPSRPTPSARRSTPCSAPTSRRRARASTGARAAASARAPAAARAPRRAATRRLGQPGALDYVCRRLDVPPAEATASRASTHLFSLEPRPAARCCTSAPTSRARLAGAEAAAAARTRARASACASGRRASLVVDGSARRPEPRAACSCRRVAARRGRCRRRASRGLRLLRRIGAGVDPTSLDAYRAARRLRRAARARSSSAATGVVARGTRVAASLGRGGAAFPTGRKWEAVARAAARRTTSSATPTSRSPARSRTAC